MQWHAIVLDTTGTTYKMNVCNPDAMTERNTKETKRHKIKIIKNEMSCPPQRTVYRAPSTGCMIPAVSSGEKLGSTLFFNPRVDG